MPRAEDAETLADACCRARRGARLRSIDEKFVEVASVYCHLLRLCLDNDVLHSVERVPDDDRKAVGDSDAAGRYGMDSGIVWALPERDDSVEATGV